MATSFFSPEELSGLGLGGFGKNVLISRHARLYCPEKLFLGNHVRIDDFCIISAGGGIRIGDYVHIAPFCGLYGGAGIDMADFSGLSSKVSLYSVSDDFSGCSLVGPMVPQSFRRRLRSGRISLGKFAVIGVGSSVMPGVTMSEGSAIGAHSFVTKDCEEWSIYSGNPATKVSRRSREMLRLEAELRKGEIYGTHGA